MEANNLIELVMDELEGIDQDEERLNELRLNLLNYLDMMQNLLDEYREEVNSSAETSAGM